MHRHGPPRSWRRSVLERDPAVEHAAGIDDDEQDQQEDGNGDGELDKTLAAAAVALAREEACDGRAH
jgi:hypothetical protein